MKQGRRHGRSPGAQAALAPRAPASPSPPAGGDREPGGARRNPGARPRAGRKTASDLEPSGDLVLLGEFGRAHGLKGELRLKSFTGEPQAIATYGPLIADSGRAVTLGSVRPTPGGAPDLLVARVEGVATREAAEALNGVRLFIPRERLPSPEEDEFLLADLIGLRVEDRAGSLIGTVVGVPNYGSGDLLEIAPPEEGATALLPFTKTFVPAVELASRRVIADPPLDLFAPAKPARPEEPA
jgi:16S rRNA processing protein RimM